MLPAPPGHRPRGKTKGAGGAGARRHHHQSPLPQVSPVEMMEVKGILREFDRGAYGEAFRGDRLVKIAVLGKGEIIIIYLKLFRNNKTTCSYE